MDVRRLVDTVEKSYLNYPAVTFSKKGSIYTCINPFSYYLVRDNPEIYDKMDGLYVDGILMCKMINWCWNKSIPRLSFDMSGMAVELFQTLNVNSKTIYFIGAKQEYIEQSIYRIKQVFSNINILGFRNGYFSSSNERIKVLNDIICLNPDYVIIGMGAPIQEQFAIDLKNNGYKGIAFTCGGFLHQTANKLNYYPEWINRYNLRAFYRLFHEKGLWRRLWRVFLQFPILFIIDTIKYKIYNPSR